MAFAISSVVRRHMKLTGRYRDAQLAPLPFATTLVPEERVLGWYQNPEPWEQSVLVFTTDAIHAIQPGHLVRVNLSDIVGYEYPPPGRPPVGVRVVTRDGFRFLRAAGSFGPSGAQLDALCLIQVLLAIIRRNTRTPP